MSVNPGTARAIMPITLLLDLDDTLLESNMDVFIPAYFKALSTALADKVAPEVMIPALTSGTKAMMVNMDPGAALCGKSLMPNFFPNLGLNGPCCRQPSIVSTMKTSQAWVY